MGVNLLTCSASAWRGAGDLCRWCNQGEAYVSSKFCSRACVEAYALNHQYTRGRELVLTWHRTCKCDVVITKSRYNFFELKREFWEAEPPHVVCVGCGDCEARILGRNDRLTINHIIPCNGEPAGIAGCYNHLENLEPLCWSCHEQLNKLGNDREKLEPWIAQNLPMSGWPPRIDKVSNRRS